MLDLVIGNLKFALCKVISHKEVYGGSCPYTGMRYNYCERCESMIPIDYIDQDRYD